MGHAEANVSRSGLRAGENDDIYATRRSQVEAKAGYGVAAADIARVLDIELDLLTSA